MFVQNAVFVTIFREVTARCPDEVLEPHANAVLKYRADFKEAAILHLIFPRLLIVSICLLPEYEPANVAGP